jgi:hypothetical protein
MIRYQVDLQQLKLYVQSSSSMHLSHLKKCYLTRKLILQLTLQRMCE